MKQFLMKMEESLRRYMYGRYGVDELSRLLMGVAFVPILLSVFTTPWLSLVGFALLIYTYWRIFSKNIYKRAGENTKYLQLRYRIQNWKRKQAWMKEQKKEFHIYKCPKCKQKIRIPRGKGRISIRCPKCSHEFIKKS